MDDEQIIRITEDDLNQNAPHTEIKITNEELEESHGKVSISEQVFNEICNRTRQYSEEKRGEFWLFLMGQGEMAEHTVEVGRGHQIGVVANTEEVVAILRPWIEQGYRVVADYHNHPPQSILDYRANNKPDDYAISPSISDITSVIYPAVIDQLRQNPYPRIIGAVPEEQGIVMSGFQIIREPGPDEQKIIELEEPTKILEEEDENGIKMLPAVYTDPKKMISLGIVKAVDIAIPIQDGEITMPSPF